MSKLHKSLFVLSAISVLSLSGCIDWSKPGDVLPISAEEAKDRMIALGKEDGFEIKYYGAADDSDGTHDEGEITFSMKGDVCWVVDEDGEIGGKAVVDNKTVSFSYDEESDKYLGTVTDETSEAFDAYVETASSYFVYIANTYSGVPGFHKVKEITYLDRAATEYSFDFKMVVVQVKFTIIVDNALGITLYYDTSAKTFDGETGNATFGVTSFKTGSEVVAPTIEIVEEE